MFDFCQLCWCVCVGVSFPHCILIMCVHRYKIVAALHAVTLHLHIL